MTGHGGDIKAATHILGEVLLDDLVGELVDLDVLVVLKALDLVQPPALLNHAGDAFEIGASHLEQVVDAVEHHLHYLSVLATEKPAEWRDHPLTHEVANLRLVARNRQVRDGPRRLLLRLELALETCALYEAGVQD